MRKNTPRPTGRPRAKSEIHISFWTRTHPRPPQSLTTHCWDPPPGLQPNRTRIRWILLFILRVRRKKKTPLLQIPPNRAEPNRTEPPLPASDPEHDGARLRGFQPPSTCRGSGARRRKRRSILKLKKRSSSHQHQRGDATCAHTVAARAHLDGFRRGG